jgi:uncharacterized protein YjeT (DUF2065 family)
MTKEFKMKSIFFFVGIMLTAMGLIIMSSGVYYYFYPNGTKTVLAELHPNIWWGMIMILAGLIFYFSNRNKFVE